jgi:hypothetical protein
MTAAVLKFAERRQTYRSTLVWLKGHNGITSICVNPLLVTHLTETSHGRQTRIHFTGAESVVANGEIADVAARLGH